jgi:hypothetical protein
MSRLLLYLPALACPLLMLVCMAAMRRTHRPPVQAEQPAASTEQRIAQLERELAGLRAERAHAGEPATEAAATSGRPSSRATADDRQPGIVTMPASGGDG